MSVYALQPRRFVEGLSVKELLDDNLFEEAKKKVEEYYGDFYWDGDLEWHRDKEIRRCRKVGLL